MAFKASGGTVDLPGFFSDLVRCETCLYNALNDGLRERHGIVTSQFEALRYLRDHPGPGSPTWPPSSPSASGPPARSSTGSKRADGSSAGRTRRTADHRA